MTGGLTKDTQTVGSESIVDVTANNVPILIHTSTAQTTSLGGSILLENAVLKNVSIAVQDGAGTTILAGSSASITIPQWIQGNVASGSTVKYTQAQLTPPAKPLSLTANGKVFGRPRPQYEGYSASRTRHSVLSDYLIGTDVLLCRIYLSQDCRGQG